MQSNQHCSVDLPHCTHLDGIWNKQGLQEIGARDLPFCSWSQKAKFTPPYPSLSLAQEKGAAVLICFMGRQPHLVSSYLLCIRPSLLPGWEELTRRELICLWPYMKLMSPLGSWPSAQLCLLSKSQLTPGYWLAPHSVSVKSESCPVQALSIHNVEPEKEIFCVETLGSSLSQILCDDLWT